MLHIKLGNCVSIDYDRRNEAVIKGIRMIRIWVLLLILVLLVVPLPIQAEDLNIVVVGYDPNFPPVHFRENEEAVGFAVDLMNEIAKRMDYEVVYYPIAQANAAENLSNNRIDILLTTFFNDALSEMEFSESILDTSIGLIVPVENQDIEGLAQLNDAVTALQKDTLEYNFLRNIRSIKYHVTSSQLTALELLIKGRADALVGNVITAEYVLEQRQLQDDFKIVGNYLLPVDYAMAVQRDNYQLLSQINFFLRQMKIDGTYSAIYEKWFQNDNLIEERLWLAVQIIGVLLFVLIGFFLLGVRWNKQLQHEVTKKTAVLHQVNQQLEEKIKETKNSAEFQKQILNSSPRGIFTLNDQGIISSVNQSALDMSGESFAVIHQHYQTVPLLTHLLRGRSEQIFQMETTFIREEDVWQKNERDVYYLRYYLSPLYDFEKSLKGLIISFEDITQEKKIREQLFEQEKNQALSRVVAGIAHEVRNPLTSIKTFAELIPYKFQNQRFQKEISTYVPQEIERISQIIQGLIDYAKPNQLNKEKVNAAHVVKECFILFERTALNKGVVMKIETEEELWFEADANQLKQVLINLVINSLDAITALDPPSEQEPLLTISTSATDQEIIISVSDTGEGMTEQEQERAFELFYTTKAKGTGLGLSITSQFIKENKGTMSVSSKKGEGTTVTLLFSRIREDVEGKERYEKNYDH